MQPSVCKQFTLYNIDTMKCRVEIAQVLQRRYDM